MVSAHLLSTLPVNAIAVSLYAKLVTMVIGTMLHDMVLSHVSSKCGVSSLDMSRQDRDKNVQTATESPLRDYTTHFKAIYRLLLSVVNPTEDNTISRLLLCILTLRYRGFGVRLTFNQKVQDLLSFVS